MASAFDRFDEALKEEGRKAAAEERVEHYKGLAAWLEKDDAFASKPLFGLVRKGDGGDHIVVERFRPSPPRPWHRRAIGRARSRLADWLEGLSERVRY